MNSQRTLTAIIGRRPRAAVGSIQRTVNDQVVDDAYFAFLSPDRWRVLRNDGSEIVVDGLTWWERSRRDAVWERKVSDVPAPPHHDGYLQAMLFPRLLPPFTDPKTVVSSEVRQPDGSLHLVMKVADPVADTWFVVVSAEGYLARLEGTDGGATSIVELTADFDQSPNPGVFDPDTPWDPGRSGEA